MEQQIICGTAGKVWTLIQMRVIETSRSAFVLDGPTRCSPSAAGAARILRTSPRNSAHFSDAPPPRSQRQSKRIAMLNRDVQVPSAT